MLNVSFSFFWFTFDEPRSKLTGFKNFKERHAVISVIMWQVLHPLPQSVELSLFLMSVIEYEFVMNDS
jgi:hypothetical protein